MMKFKLHIKDVKKLNNFKAFCVNNSIFMVLFKNDYGFNLSITTRMRLRAIEVVADKDRVTHVVFEYSK